MTGLHRHEAVDDDRREARDIIAELVRASANVRRRRPRPRWYHRALGMEIPPAEALLVMTSAGQAGAYMTEDGSCILRCRGDANVNRHLRTILPERRGWDELERAWTVPPDALEEAFSVIVASLKASERLSEPPIGGDAPHHAHAAPTPEAVDELLLLPTTAVVMNSRYGMMSGQQRGDLIEMMVLDPRMQHDLQERAAHGDYRQERLIGLWTLPAGDFATATEWACMTDTMRPPESIS